MPGVVGIALVVVTDELDGTSQESAFGVDVIAPDFQRQKILLALGRNRAGERHAETDLDRIGCARGTVAHWTTANKLQAGRAKRRVVWWQTSADLLPRHDGSDRLALRALLVARAKSNAAGRGGTHSTDGRFVASG